MRKEEVVPEGEVRRGGAGGEQEGGGGGKAGCGLGRRRALRLARVVATATIGPRGPSEVSPGGGR